VSYRVLVVDDEVVLRTVIVRALRLDDLDVTEAVDGNDGWALAQRVRFDLVVTDSRMPGMSGAQLAGRLRAMDPGLPILHLSGSHGMEEPMPAGVPTLFKPFDLDRLLVAVRALLPSPA
jgi:two-component system OmpR family response regulator